MAEFISLYSGSSGNSSVVRCGSRYLIVDMGKGVRTTSAALKALGLAVSDCDGILVTHEHSDHVKGLSTFLKKNPLPVYGAADTLDFLDANGIVPPSCELNTLEGREEDVGAFGVQSFPTSHDVPCVGYRIHTPDGKTITIPLDDKAFRYWNVKTDRWEVEGGSYQLLVGASSADIRLTAVVTVEGTNAPDPYAGLALPHYRTGEVASVPDAEYEALLGRPLPEGKVRIDRNMTLGEMGHGRSPLGWIAAAVLGALLNRSIKKGKPDLNILFQYNMPLRALAKMTNGAISMGMVDGIVMELKGFWIIGILRVIWEALKNVVLNSRMEERLKNS